MPESVTLEQVEELATQLPPGERLKLVARVCEQLSIALPGGVSEEQIHEFILKTGLSGEKREAWASPEASV